MKKITIFISALAIFIGIASMAPKAAVAETFVFTAIPDQDESKLIERFGKVAAYLAKELGVETKYIPVKSYAAAVTAFRNNQVQLAWFGGLSGVRARSLVEGSKAIASWTSIASLRRTMISVPNSPKQWTRLYVKLS